LGTDVINESEDEKIKNLGSKMSVIIPKWTKIPIIKKKTYETIMDYQEDIIISIYEGENEYVKYNKLLDKFYLKDIPRKPKGEVNCEVSFSIDKNNILTVTAVETSSKLSNYKEIKVVSNRRELNNINQSGGLDFKEFTELKKSSNKKIEKYLELYKKSNDNKKKN
jgi:molecular chaperone DnaK (HSP70)